MILNKWLKHARTLLVAGILVVPFTSQSFAADIRLKRDSIMGCFLEITGKIAIGDTEKVQSHVETLHNSEGFWQGSVASRQLKGRVCMNSSGGSFSEAIKLAYYLRENAVGTAIGRKKSCVSACAIAFMGGTVSYENDSGSQPDRVLNPFGELGFHAPRLEVSEGNYDEKSVEKAYLIALENISNLLGVSAKIQFPTSLAAAMFATPHTDMHFVTTVGEAALWQIAIAPVPEPETLTKSGLVNTCSHVDSAALDTHDWSNSGSSNLTISQDERGVWKGNMADGFRQELATGCQMTFRPAKANRVGRTTPSGWSSISDGWTHTWVYQTYGADQKIVNLALKNDSKAATQKEQVKSIERQMSGRCMVFKGTTLTDNDPCQLHHVARLSEDLIVREVNTFTWPSGAKTVVENVADTTKDEVSTTLNGIPTSRDLAYKNQGIEQVKTIEIYAAKVGNNNPIALCWPNPVTGNRFCFLDNKPFEESEFFKGFSD